MRCDSHVHVVAPATEHQQIRGRTFLAAPAPLEALERLAAPYGVDHFVITQPSFYGTDNTVLLDALDRLQGRGRGVAVIDPHGDDAHLASLVARGVAGLRVNIYSPAARAVGESSDDLEAVTAVAADAGLHVEIIAPLGMLIRRSGFIARSGVPTVIDHYGLFGNARPDSAEGQQLLSLVARPHVWIKLSSPYRSPLTPLNIEPDRAWLEALLAVAPGRCVWGSDWPHPPPHVSHLGPDVSVPWRPISYADLYHRFVEAVGDPGMLERILWTNPARLYDFGRSEEMPA